MVNLENISFKKRIFLWYGIVLAFIILIFSITFYVSVKFAVTKNIKNSLKIISEEIKNDTKDNLNNLQKYIIYDKNRYPLSPLYIQIYKIENNNPVIVSVSTNLKGNNLPIINYQDKNSRFNKIKAMFLKHKFIMIFTQAIDKEGKYFLEVATSIDKQNKVINILLTIFLITGPLLLFAALFVGYKVVGNALLPVKIITETANKISVADLSKRVPQVKSDDEFSKLIMTINNMIDRLEKSFNSIKQFSMNASHELKTPLTIIRGEAELALRKERSAEYYIESLNNILKEAISMQNIIESLLLFAKLDSMSLSKDLSIVKINEVVKSVVDDFSHIAKKKNITILCECKTESKSAVNVSILKIIVSNILENAIKYTPKDKNIYVSLYEDNNLFKIVIKDEGCGIEEKKLNLIFEPFYRTDEAHNKDIEGYGLGLALVKKAVDILEGKIEIESKLKAGTTVTVSFKKNRV